MFLKKLDVLSPPITLYYKGEDSHSSIVSGILSIISYGLIIVFAFLYILSYIRRENPTAFFFNRYIEDAGEFPVNASSMFNFIQMIDTTSNRAVDLDLDSIRIIGLEITIDVYTDDRDLSKIDHWLYGKCNNHSDTEGISDLINIDKYTEAACIRKYYRKDDGQYYDTDSPKFRWPDILHGCSHPNRTFYGIILEKCRDDPLKILGDGSHCKPKEKIEEYLSHNSINFYIIDHYADVLNYKKPFTKYFYIINNGLFEGSYTTNHLNFNPTKLSTHEGIFTDKVIENVAYFFDQNEKVTTESNSGIVVAFYFWMQNRLQNYERSYKKFQDALSDIGGLSEIILMAAGILNSLFNNYVIILDTEKIVLESKKNNFEDSKNTKLSKLSRTKTKKPKLFQEADEVMFPPKKFNPNHVKITQTSSFKKQNTNTQEKSKNSTYNNSGIRLKGKDINQSSAQADNNRKITQNIEINQNQSLSQIESRNKNLIQTPKISPINSYNGLEVYPIEEEKKDEKKKIEIKNTNEPINFLNYLSYLIHYCYKKQPKIRYLHNFREEIISEENIIQTHVNVFKLIELLEKEKIIKLNPKE